jgi:hypothetical protein
MPNRKEVTTMAYKPNAETVAVSARLPEFLHTELSQIAEKENRSLTGEIVHRLQQSLQATSVGEGKK